MKDNVDKGSEIVESPSSAVAPTRETSQEIRGRVTDLLNPVSEIDEEAAREMNASYDYAKEKGGKLDPTTGMHVPVQSNDDIANLESVLFKLEESLSEGIKSYDILFGQVQKYSDIDSTIQSLEYLEVPGLNENTIEIKAIFSCVDLNDPENISAYKDLLKRLVSKKRPDIQAHLLHFINLADTYLTRKKYPNQKYNLIPESDFPKKIMFDNPTFELEHRELLRRIFDLMDAEEELSIKMSWLLHRGGEKKFKKKEKNIIGKYIALLR